MRGHAAYFVQKVLLWQFLLKLPLFNYFAGQNMAISVKKALLFSIHDCAPQHLDRLRRAEELIQNCGLNKAVYLWVPFFHNRYRSLENPAFLEWCQQKRSIQVQWYLHGYYHLAGINQTLIEKTTGKPLTWIKENYLTEGEGEFMHLSSREVSERLIKGISEYKSVFGQIPAGFVAPAWLYNAHLVDHLHQNGSFFYENHFYIYHTSGKKWWCPALTWATRTPFLKWGSQITPPLLVRALNRAPLIRIAIHPHDMDHPSIVKSIERVLKYALKDRTPLWPSEIPPHL